MDKDGTKSGYDVDLLKTITNNTNIPVIASGGVGTLDHLYDGIVKGGASAVLAASIFHYGEFKIKDANSFSASRVVYPVVAYVQVGMLRITTIYNIFVGGF